MADYDIEDRLAAYRAACRKGTDWLLDHKHADGSIGPVEERNFYYRIPWALALMGETVAAHRVVDWIHRNMFTAEGAFEGISPLGVFDDRYGSYALACLLVGANLLQRYDIVYRGTQNLFSWQDPESGGFYNDRKNKTASGEQELFPTAQGGMSLVAVGQIEAARKAGQWLKRLWELQPDVEHKMYHVYSPEKGLVADYAPDQEALYLTKKDDPWQHHFNGGIAAALLSTIYLATGEQTWLDMARKYQEFSMTTDACQFQSMQTCKSGWGAGLLYMITREQRYRDWTVRMGDWFLGHQYDDGHWEGTKYWEPNPTTADNIHTTAEFVMHVANIVANLSV